MIAAFTHNFSSPEGVRESYSRRTRNRLFGHTTALGMILSLGACTTNANVENAVKNLHETQSTTLLDLAWAAASRDDHFAAIPMFRRAHQKNSGAAEPLTGLGHSLMAVGQYNEAAIVLQKAIEKSDGTQADPYIALGQSLMILGNYDGAALALNSAVNIDPSNARALSALGVALDALGDHAQAVETFHAGLNQSPNDLNLRSNLGLSLSLHGESAEALNILEDVVRNAQSTARHRQNLALAYALSGDVKRGAQMASIDLDHRSVLANLGYVDMLRALPDRDRMAAMLGGHANPKRTIDGAARRLVNDDDPWARATIARLLPIEVARVSQPIAVRDPVALGGVPPLMDPNGWAVQIAAYRKLEHLAPGWAFLSQKYGQIIGDLEPRRSEVDHPAREKGPVGFFYRLNAGPLASRQEAENICRQMKAAGAECWVRAPEPAEGRLPDNPGVEEDFISSVDHNTVMNQMAQRVINDTPNIVVRPLADTVIAFTPDILQADYPLLAGGETVTKPVTVAARADVPELAMPDALETPVTVAARADVPELEMPDALEIPVTVAARADVPVVAYDKVTLSTEYEASMEIEPQSLFQAYPVKVTFHAPVVNARRFVPVLSLPESVPANVNVPEFNQPEFNQPDLTQAVQFESPVSKDQNLLLPASADYVDDFSPETDEASIFGEIKALRSTDITASIDTSLDTRTTSDLSQTGSAQPQTGAIEVSTSGLIRLNARPNKLNILSAFEEAEQVQSATSFKIINKGQP